MGQELIGWRAGFDSHLAEVVRPLSHALVDNGSIEITLLAILRDCGVDNRHFLIGERFVDAQFDFCAVLCQALSNLGQVVAEHRDAPLDFAFVVAVVEPLALAEVADFHIAQTFELRVQKHLIQGVFAAQLLEGILRHVDRSFLVSLSLFKRFGFVEYYGDKLW